ncbi:hypothetical protein EB001_01715 [bacterium]|nr:hypothetical protein [bacterium]
MSKFITSYDQWLEFYRKDKLKIWIRVITSDNTEYYLPEFLQWLELKQLCEDKKLKINKVGLQYRSHSIEVDTSDADGVYLVRSLIGVMGENSKQTITIGKLYGSIIKKTMWITPELVEELSSEDTVEDSFKEALILNYEKQTGTV